MQRSHCFPSGNPDASCQRNGHAFHFVQCLDAQGEQSGLQVVNGRGVPQRTLTDFYRKRREEEGLEQAEARVRILFPYFTFLEHMEEGSGSQDFRWIWYSPCSQVQQALDVYLFRSCQ